MFEIAGQRDGKRIKARGTANFKTTHRLCRVRAFYTATIYYKGVSHGIQPMR